MQIADIPFVRRVGIEQNAEGLLVLAFTHEVQNHLQTVHASAQIALAETASGAFLGQRFSRWAGAVVPVLRQAQSKFKHPAQTDLTAFASVSEEAAVSFERQLQIKRRGLIEICVDIKDTNDKLTCVGRFTWYVQLLEGVEPPAPGVDA